MVSAAVLKEIRSMRAQQQQTNELLLAFVSISGALRSNCLWCLNAETAVSHGISMPMTFLTKVLAQLTDCVPILRNACLSLMVTYKLVMVSSELDSAVYCRPTAKRRSQTVVY